MERESPLGVKDPASIPSVTVQLEGEDRGANIVMEIHTKFELEGLYWFSVFFDDELLTRMPLRVLYSRAQEAA